jgi:hypothetical protein
MIADTHEALLMLKRLRVQVNSAISSIEAGEIRANKSASVLSFYDMIVGDFGISRTVWSSPTQAIHRKGLDRARVE